MNSVASVIIIVAWVVLVVLGVTFMAIYGNPQRSPDPPVSWHLVAATAVGVAQPLAFLLAGVSLWPSAVVEVVAAGVVGWRLALLVQTRRAARADLAVDDADRPPPG